MTRHPPIPCCLSLLLVAFMASLASAANWPSWRGPAGDGVPVDKNLPLTWSASESFCWRTARSTCRISRAMSSYSVQRPSSSCWPRTRWARVFASARSCTTIFCSQTVANDATIWYKKNLVMSTCFDWGGVWTRDRPERWCESIVQWSNSAGKCVDNRRTD